MTTYEQLGYTNMTAWPADCGAPPSPELIMQVRCLHIAKPATKRELALATYIRETALNYNTQQVAYALQQAMGGQFNPILNAVNITFKYMKLGECVTAKVNNGTAYKLILNDKAMRLLGMSVPVKGSVDDYGQPLPVTVEAPKPVEVLVETVTPAKAGKGTKGKGKGKTKGQGQAPETAISEPIAAPGEPTVITGSSQVADALVEAMAKFDQGYVPDTDAVMTEIQPDSIT